MIAFLCYGILRYPPHSPRSPTVSVDKTSVYPGDSVRFTLQDTIGLGGNPNPTRHAYFTKCEAVWTNDKGNGENANGDIPQHIKLTQKYFYRNVRYQISATFTATEHMLQGKNTNALKPRHDFVRWRMGGSSSYKYWLGDVKVPVGH